MRLFFLVIISAFLATTAPAILVSNESTELATNSSFRLAKIYYSINPFRTLELLHQTIRETKDNSAAKDLLVSAYYDLITQIHIEYITLSSQEIAENNIVDLFNSPKTNTKSWLFSQSYYLQGKIFTTFNKEKANRLFIESLTYDPTNYKSLLWLVKNIDEEFPESLAELRQYLKAFAEIMPQIKQEKIYLGIMRESPHPHPLSHRERGVKED